MYIYKSRYLTRGEVWYDDEPGDTGSVDWLLYQQRSAPVPGARWEYFYNYFVDLNQSVEHLLERLDAGTAYKIRRARDRDKIVCETCDTRDASVLDRFEEVYNQFAEMKGLAPLNRARMDAMSAAGALDLSVAKDPRGNALVYHANHRDQQRATELHLPSLYRKSSESATRNLIGRANRYLTWTDILRYQEQGLKFFDFGGWYAGTDPGMLKINDFKKGFGGQITREYQCEQIRTLKGRVVLCTASLLERAKSFSLRPKKSTVDVPPDLVHDTTPARAD